MTTYNFRQCTRVKLDDLFGLRRTFDSTVLDHWLQTKPMVSEKEKGILEIYQELLLLNDDSWNEQELSLNFIGPVFGLVRFTEPYRFNHFAERKIGATIAGVDGDIDLNGEPDGMIATGYRTPKIPMFAFSEYKRELGSDGDPAGQSLAAMLVGQALNEKPIPIYGCYIIGRVWRFLVLEEKNYTISRDYLSTTDDLFNIFAALKALKMIIMELTTNE